MDDYFQCDHCKRMFTRKYNLVTHIINCHVNTSYCCEICGETFLSPTGLFQHLGKGHNSFKKGNPECDLCGRIFTRKQNIRSHMLTVHLQTVLPQVQCPHCEKQFTAGRNLTRHVKQVHNPHLQLPTCDYCLRSFKGKRTLQDHIQANHSENMATCLVCNKKYSNHRNLKRHIENFHGNKNEFKCEICPKVYSTNQSLRRHTKSRHTPSSRIASEINYYYSDTMSINIRFECESCNRNFKDEYFLRQHIKNEHSFTTFYNYCRQYLLKQEALKPVTNTKLMYCEFCDYIAFNINELKSHSKNIHNKEIIILSCHVCFKKFVSQQALNDHKTFCVAPVNAHQCSHCDKLFTDISSLEFHMKVFHTTIQTPDISESIHDDTVIEQDSSCAVYKCTECSRAYYSDRSLKHHIKLKHTTEEAVVCGICTKVCSNKYYLASHIKIVHSAEAVSKCDYCDKYFKSKRNIRRHIEFTHLGMRRHKCLECDTLFKEKRSLRKHVRVKHANSVVFPKCHICNKGFESAKSCKIHLKLVHSCNLNTHPCHLCSVSFNSFELLKDHVQTKHSAEDQIYKCEDCGAIIYGQEKLDSHNEFYHMKNIITPKMKMLPRCVICVKDFSTKKTLKRHIKKFHSQFDVEKLANFGFGPKPINIQCDECLINIHDDNNYLTYTKLKNNSDSLIFTCSVCSRSYKSLEYAIHRYRLVDCDSNKSKVILSDLCTAEMSEESDENINIKEELMEPENSSNDITIESVQSYSDKYIKSEPKSP